MILCTPILYGFVKYVRAHSREALWQEFKTLASAAGPMFSALFRYLAVSFPSECKEFAGNIYLIIKDILYDFFGYLRNNAIEDIWSLMKNVHRVTLRLCVWLNSWAFGPGENVQQ